MNEKKNWKILYFFAIIFVINQYFERLYAVSEIAMLAPPEKITLYSKNNGLIHIILFILSQ